MSGRDTRDGRTEPGQPTAFEETWGTIDGFVSNAPVEERAKLYIGVLQAVTLPGFAEQMTPSEVELLAYALQRDSEGVELARTVIPDFGFYDVAEKIASIDPDAAEHFKNVSMDADAITNEAWFDALIFQVASMGTGMAVGGLRGAAIAGEAGIPRSFGATFGAMSGRSAVTPLSGVLKGSSSLAVGGARIAARLRSVLPSQVIKRARQVALGSLGVSVGALAVSVADSVLNVEENEQAAEDAAFIRDQQLTRERIQLEAQLGRQAPYADIAFQAGENTRQSLLDGQFVFTNDVSDQLPEALTNLGDLAMQGTYSYDPSKPNNGRPDPRLEPEAFADNPYVGGYSEDYTISPPAQLRKRPLEPIRPRYFLSDLEALMGTLSPRRLDELQEKLIVAGLIDPKTKTAGVAFQEGVLGPHTKNALVVLLDEANGQGRRWEDVLEQLYEQGDGLKSDRAPFLRRAYLSLDPATGRQLGRNTIEQRLGRTADSWELAMLGGYLQDQHRAQFEAEEQARYNEWVAQGRAEEVGEDFVIPEEVQGVDYGARFDEKFRTQFAGEIDRADRTAQVDEATGRLMTGLNRVAGMFG